MLRLKAGANPYHLQPEVVLLAMIVFSVYAKYGYDCEITSLYDDAPGRLARSLHRRDEQCRAADFKTKHVHRQDLEPMRMEIRRAVGQYGQFYDFIYEPEERDDQGRVVREEHYHAEYDPKP